MKTIKEKIIEQITLQEKIQKLAKVNLITCGNCEAILLHDIKKNQVDCYVCGNMIDLHHCPDFWYKGLENSDLYNNL
jgi:hypothetical protein